MDQPSLRSLRGRNRGSAHMQQRPVDGSPATRTILELAALEKKDYQTALQRILKADAEALGVERVGYWSLDGQTLTSELSYVGSLGAFERGLSIEQQDYPDYFRALREANVILADDVRADPRTHELREGYLRRLGIRSLMNVPVWSRGRLVGVLCHEHTGYIRHWSPEECDLSLAVAQVIATTHEVRGRMRAEEAAQRAIFLSEATEELMEVLDVEEVPEQLVHFAVEEIADWCLLDELDERRELKLIAAAHRNPAHRRNLDSLTGHRKRQATDSELVLEALTTGRSLLFPMVNEETFGRLGIVGDAMRQVERLGARSAMLVPLVARGRVLAAITLVSSSRVFGRDDLQLAEGLARRAAVHLDNVRLYRAAREAVAARDEFIAVASHELNTPLTSLGLAVDSLRKGGATGSPDTIVRACDLVQRQQRRLTRLVREMLDVTRIQARRLSLKREDFDLSELMREICLAFEPQLTRAGAPLLCHIDESVRGSWDRPRLERVFENLLSNAIKFGDGKPVELHLRARDDVVEVRVVDHGIGIGPDRMSLIFERFERGARSAEFTGLGLGLYIARGIVEAHGGRISVESTPAEGSTFTVVLPRERTNGHAR